MTITRTDTTQVDFATGILNGVQATASGLQLLTALSLAEFNADGNLGGWTPYNISGYSVANGEFSGTTATTDPQLMSPALGLDGSVWRYVIVKYRAVGGDSTSGQIYFQSSASPGLSESKKADWELALDGQWHVACIDMWNAASGSDIWRTGTITGFRVDPGGLANVFIEIDYIRVGQIPVDGNGAASGTRVSPTLDLSPVGIAASSLISWISNTPPGTSVVVETSLDNGITWQQATNGRPIPGISLEMNLTGKSLLVRQTLTTSDLTVTPTLSGLTVMVESLAVEPSSVQSPYQTILVFDGQSETLLAILANHEQACPFWDAIHDEQLNRLNTFDFSIPADHESAAYVVEGNLAAYMDPDGDWQLFQIVRVEDVRSDTPGASIRNVYCETAANELLDEIITSLNLNGVSAQFALMQVLQGARWSVGQVDNLGENSASISYATVLSAVQTILNTWGGQVKYRVTMQGNRITGRFIDIRASRGQNRGRVFRYGKDLVQPRRVVDTSNVKTALYGRGQGQQSADGSDTRITFADVVWSKANGDPVDKPAGQEWVGDPDALAQWGRDGGTRHRYGIYENPDTTDPVQLLQETWEALQQQKTPLFSYEAQVIDLERIPGYEDEAVRLGDTVRVIDETFNPPLDLWATVVEVKRNLMEPLKTEITLGNFLPLITDDGQRLRQIEASLHDNQGIWDSKLGPGDKIQTSWLDGVINVLNNELQSTGGYVYVTDQDGILVLDKPRDQNPTKALQLKGGIFAISDQKDANGNWIWRTFGDGTGFTASELKTGTLLASLVNILAGNYVRLDGNGLTVTDASNVQQVQLGQYASGKYGLLVMNGEIYSTYISTRPPGVTKAFAELTTGGTLNIYDTNGLLGMSVGGGSGQGRLIWYLSGTMYADSEIDSGSTRDLLIRALTSGSGIQLQAIPSGNKITIGSGGQNGVYITAGTTDMSGNAHVGGSLVVTGTFIANGGKNALQDTKSYGQRLLSVRESPDVRYVDEGFSTLTNGECRIALDPIFLECIEPHSDQTPWYIHLTPYGDVGLYVAEIGADYFVVRERGGGTTTGAQFSWSLSAVRLGYAGVRLPPFESPIEPVPSTQTASATAQATSTMSATAS